MNTVTNVWKYKTCVRPIITYVYETTANDTQTKRMITTEKWKFHEKSQIHTDAWKQKQGNERKVWGTMDKVTKAVMERAYIYNEEKNR